MISYIFTSAISSIHPPWPSCITRNISNSSCTLTWLPIANGEAIDAVALGSVPAVAVGLAGEGVAIAVAAVAGERVATAAGVGTAGAVVVGVSAGEAEVTGALRLGGGVKMGATGTGATVGVFWATA